MLTIGNLLPIIPNYLRLLRTQYADERVVAAETRRRKEQTLRAAALIPFYRERCGSKYAADELRHFPILKRADIPRLNRSVRELAGGRAILFHENSSGSTGMPVEFLFDAPHQRGRFAARIRYLRANGWNPLRRTTWIVAYTSRGEESLDSQISHSRLRLRSSFPKTIFRPFEEQVDALVKSNPAFIYTMPSNLEGLLNVFERRATKLDYLRCIFSGGEVLDAALRERARGLLKVDIRDNYGSTEGFISWQCPAGKYHINAEHVVVEIVDDSGHAVAAGQIGKVLITTLENHLMPLVRYEIGDYAVASDEICSCGRTLPVMGKVIGRGINLFRLPGDRLVSPWPLVGPLKSRSEIRQFQIVQQTHHHYLVRYVCDRELDRDSRQDIQTGFGKILGIEVTISFERMEAISRTAGAKFMTALSLLSA